MIRRMKTKPIPKNIGEYLELSEDSPSGLIWKKKSAKQTKIGSTAGSFDKSTSRWSVYFKGKNYYCYRIVYFLRTGILPDNQCIDHANRMVSTNKNLRLATSSQNNANKLIPKANTSGFKGVIKCGKKWRAVIKVNSLPIHLGVFIEKEEAARAYNDAALEHFGEFACLNPI